MVTQNAQMTHKIAVVDEVRTRIGGASASIVSEYRGLSVAELAELRTALAAVGGDYRIFKNTLVRRAIDGGEQSPGVLDGQATQAQLLDSCQLVTVEPPLASGEGEGDEDARARQAPAHEPDRVN